MLPSSELSRRDFLNGSAVGAASVALPYFVSASALGMDNKPNGTVARRTS